jgi:molecular chaperone DnaK (HSP70)
VTEQLAVGIDLGTTHTVVAWSPIDAQARPEIFRLPQLVGPSEVEARELLASVLYAPAPGERVADPWNDAPWVVGEYARRRGQEIPGRAVLSAKSWLSHAAVDRTAEILPWGAADGAGLARVSPVGASARVLAHVRRCWDEAHPEHPLSAQYVVLTVPASFDQAARQLTLRAAESAGLGLRLLEEPQAAFYDCMQRSGTGPLETLADQGGGLALVCDVGGGTTDLTLIRIARGADGSLALCRVAVGRHLLLGGDNMDLALAHLCEERLVARPDRLDPQRFAQLVLACRAAKERLLGDQPPEQAPIAIAGSGSALVGSTLSTRLGREEAERIVLEGFLPMVGRDARPQRGRAGLLAFGLPYEHDPAITRHLAEFFERHAEGAGGPRALLLNGGVFRARQIAERVSNLVADWTGTQPIALASDDPDLAVARGAVAYALAVAGFGTRIGGGSAHGYFVAVSGEGPRRAICVVPRGAKEGERHLAGARPLALRVGEPARFELFASDSGHEAPGEIVNVEQARFERLPPVATTFEGAGDTAAGREVTVAVEGELSAIGTLELACVELGRSPRRWALAFELRARDQARRSEQPRPSSRLDARFEQARDAIERVFGKPREGVREREVKDLWRELERLLGERSAWTGELARSLFDVVGPLPKARRRSADHERVWWMLAGFCLRPGWGHPLDPRRIRIIAPLFEQGLAFQEETRGWQQYWIAWRRIAGGLDEALQQRIRQRLDPFLAPADERRKKPKGFRPQAFDELLELASALERVSSEGRAELGRWLLERTWTDRNPRLWAAIGRIGARAPAYASLHHVVAAKTVERWLDHLMREKWNEVPTAARAAVQLARVTGDRARDLPEPVRERVAAALERHGADAEWTRALRELVPLKDTDRAEFFGEELPVGLRLVD